MSGKILYVVNSARYFVQHRLALAEAAQKAGYSVGVATVLDYEDYVQDIIDANISIFSLGMSRRGLGVFENFKTVNEIHKIIRSFNPNLIHSLTIKPVVFSGLVTKITKTPFVSLIPGRGTAFSLGGLKGKILNLAATNLYKLSLSNKNSLICFENEEDRSFFIQKKLVPEERSIRVFGSGVDTEKFFFTEPKDKDTVQVLMACRLLREKGIFEFAQASQILSKEFPQVKFVLLGSPDSGNPTSVTDEELKDLCEKKNVTHIPHVKDVPALLAQADIFCLPTFYNEGIPVSILEASSMGKPVVTTNIPGCRDAVAHAKTGLLVEPKSVEDLVKALRELIGSPQKRKEFGSNGRKLVEEKFALPKIIDSYLDIYQKIKK
jgi:glycosyltransferase involved in cell wall biosynthesis